MRGIDGYKMPATQHDLWVWVAGHAYHTVFDVAREAIENLFLRKTVRNKGEGEKQA